MQGFDVGDNEDVLVQLVTGLRVEQGDDAVGEGVLAMFGEAPVYVAEREREVVDGIGELLGGVGCDGCNLAGARLDLRDGDRSQLRRLAD